MATLTRLAVSAALALAVMPSAALAQADPDQQRVEQTKQKLLARIKRDKVTYRGKKPGEIRLRWEWWDRVISRYTLEKQILLRELSVGEKHQLREEWAFKNMTVTFQELFGLGPEEDATLVPIVSSRVLLNMAPRSTFEGLTLLGKQGEVKGPVTRKYKEKVFTISDALIVTRLEYRGAEGKLQKAVGIHWDSFTVRWQDVKNRVADLVSEENAMEDLALVRDASYPPETEE